MYAVKTIYVGVNFKPKQPISVNSKCFLRNCGGNTKRYTTKKPDCSDFSEFLRGLDTGYRAAPHRAKCIMGFFMRPCLPRE